MRSVFRERSIARESLINWPVLVFQVLLTAILLWAAPSASAQVRIVQDVGEYEADEPIGQKHEVWSDDAVRGTRKTLRQSGRIIGYAIETWTVWLLRAALFLLIAALAGIVDRRLILQWKEQGIPALRENVPVALYAYLLVLFDRRAHLFGKAIVASTILYGVVRWDFLPDRSLLGLVDDIVLIVVATRIFVRTCPEGILVDAAARAVQWRRRSLALRRQRR